MQATKQTLPAYAVTQSPLSEAQVSEFAERGYLVVDLDVSSDFLDRLVARVESCYPEDRRLNPTAPARAQDAWKRIDEVRQLAVLPLALGALEQLFGRRALPFQTLNFPIGTRQATHSDIVHFNSIPSGFMAGVWVALEDIDLDNGPLQYYPGSHLLPEYAMQDFDLEPSYDNYRFYEESMKALVEARGLQHEFGAIKRGQALIWHANLLHGGAAQTDLSRSRHSQVTHYYFEDCQYYTPMHSSAAGLALRDPFWIPAAAEFKLPEDRPVSRLKRFIRRFI